jgi:hypothetical protein
VDAGATTFYVAGAVLELGGILLLAWPDFSPYTEPVSRWLVRLLAALGWRRAHVYVDAMTATMTLTGSVSALVTMNPDATMEERVEYPPRREHEAQLRLNQHDERIRAMEEHVPSRLEELRAETKEHVSESLRVAELQYRVLRFVGAILLVLGLAFTTAANFL